MSVAGNVRWVLKGWFKSCVEKIFDSSRLFLRALLALTFLESDSTSAQRYCETISIAQLWHVEYSTVNSNTDNLRMEIQISLKLRVARIIFICTVFLRYL